MSGVLGKLKSLERFLKNPDSSEIKQPKNMSEVIENLPPSFKVYMESELIYRRLSSIAFILIVLVLGTPLWWHTTETYRAPFNVFPIEQEILLGVRVYLAVTDATIVQDIEILARDLMNKLNSEEIVAPLIIEWSLNNTGLRDIRLLQLERGCSEELDIRVALVPTSQWPHFSATNVQLGRGRWTFIQWTGIDDQHKILTRLHSAIWEVMVDVPHLNSIMKRGLRQKIQPWHIATLPQSHQKRLVWDSTPISMDYVIQIIFLHENGAPPSWCGKRTIETVWRFGDKLKNVTQLHISSEHLWDMEISHFLAKDIQDRWTLSHQEMERLLKEIDAQLQTVESAHPVLKIVILETGEPIIVLDQFGDDSRGVVIASWGAVIPRSEFTEERILAAIRVLLGVDADLSNGWVRDPVPIADWEIDRLRLRAVVDNAMRSISAVAALKALTEKITNIVIRDDVAERASEAVKLVTLGLKDKHKPDLNLISSGRRLADDALSHPSLLSLLYFPKDQKMAVYLPIMLPTLIPLLGSILAIFKWIFNKI